MPSSDDGHVREEIGALREAVNNLTRIWSQQDSDANEGRRELHRKVEALKDEVRLNSSKTDLAAAKVDALAEDFKSIEPVVRRFENARHHSNGARWAFGLVWGTLVGGVAAVAWVIHEWAGLIIGLLWPPKH